MLSRSLNPCPSLTVTKQVRHERENQRSLHQTACRPVTNSRLTFTIPISISGSHEQYSLQFMKDTIMPTETQPLTAAISACICELLTNCSYSCFWFL